MHSSLKPPNLNDEPVPLQKTIRRVGAKPPPDRAPRSIYCFSVKNPIRKRIIELVEWKPFDFLIIITILCNCIALAVYSPFPMDDTDETNLILVGQANYQCRVIMLSV